MSGLLSDSFRPFSIAIGQETSFHSRLKEPPFVTVPSSLDNGREFARPIELERKLGLPVFFAHPYHSWERGTNENTNGLLRQYLPKGTDLTQITPEQLRSCVHALNHRPRKCLDFQSPSEVFHPQPPG
jgi:IS30 family transposase